MKGPHFALPEAEMGCVKAEAGCDASTAVFYKFWKKTRYMPRNSQGFTQCDLPSGRQEHRSIFICKLTRLSVRSQVQNFVSVRMSPSSVINCREEDFKAVLHVTEDSAKTIFEVSSLYPGAHVCQQGIRDSGTLQKLVGMERNEFAVVPCQRSIFPAARLPAVPTRSV